MHDYAGNPASYPDNVGLIDDSDPPDAAHFNVSHENHADRAAWLKAKRAVTQTMLAALVANFPRDQLSIGTRTSAPAWDGAVGRWLVGANTAKVQGSYGGAVFTDLPPGGSALSANVTAIVVSPTTGVASAVKASNSTMASLDPATDTWSEFTGPSWTSTGIQGGTYFNGLFVLWEGRASATDRLYTATDGIHYSSTLGAQLPANFGHSGATTFRIFSAQSASRLLLFSTQANFASYSTTTDGATFTTLAMPTLLSGEALVGATYDPIASLFFIILSKTSGSRLLSSPTGLAGSWTVVSTFDPAQGLTLLSGFDGSVLATILFKSALNRWRVNISVDGGVTWRPTLLEPVSGSGYVYASNSQLLYMEPTIYAPSLSVGLPPPRF